MRKDLFRKGLVLGTIFLFIGASVLPVVNCEFLVNDNVPTALKIRTVPSTMNVITVDNEGDGDHTSIQDAINHANFGDTIEVYSGTYFENVVVDKMLNLIGIDMELGSGSDTGKPIVDGGGTGTVVETTSDGVSISGFVIKNSGGSNPGLHLASHYNTVQGNVITENYYGMKLFPSTGNRIIDNIIIDNVGDGLWLSHSHENTIENNTITGNGNNGISINMSSLSNHIHFNTISGNVKNGIELSQTSFGNFMVNNNINNNGIGLKTTSGSDNNQYFKNNFIGNAEYNAYDTAQNIYSFEGMGNYWDDYTGTDSDGDGIGNIQYDIPGGDNQDYYPLMESVNHRPKKPSRPNGESGKAGKKYSYTTTTNDPNNDQIWFKWSWGDGEMSEWIGPYGSGKTCEASHIWSEEGSYEIKVKAKDEYDLESEWSDPLSVIMPKNKTIHSTFLNFLENHPHMFSMVPLLHHEWRSFSPWEKNAVRRFDLNPPGDSSHNLKVGDFSLGFTLIYIYGVYHK